MRSLEINTKQKLIREGRQRGWSSFYICCNENLEFYISETGEKCNVEYITLDNRLFLVKGHEESAVVRALNDTEAVELSGIKPWFECLTLNEHGKKGVICGTRPVTN